MVVEATATSFLIIVSNVPGLDSVVNDIGSVLFEPYNEKDLKQKIESFNIPPDNNSLDKYSIHENVKKHLLFYRNFK